MQGKHLSYALVSTTLAIGIAPPLGHLLRRPLRGLLVVAGRARVRNPVRRRRFRYGRLHGVIALANQQPPVHVAHVAVHAPRPFRLRRMERVLTKPLARERCLPC